MLIAQIVIVVSLFLGLFFITFYFHYKYGKNEIIMLSYVLIFSTLLFITIMSVIEVDKLRKKLNCPEYEKVENVYKLKH